MAPRTAFLFPGQGAYLPGVLNGWTDDFPRVRELLDAVDETAAAYGHESVGTLLTDPAGTPLDALLRSQPDLLDLAIFAVDAAAYEILTSLGLRPDVLAGHSFGELAALASAGACTPQDAARIVCERAAAFRTAPPPDGGMTAVAVDARRAGHLVGLLDDPLLSVAVDNGPGQNVVSGPEASLDRIERLAEAVEVRATRLGTAYPFHNPLLHSVTRIFSEATAGLRLQPPRIPVFSSTLGRYLTEVDDVRRLVDQHMVQPVGFYDGLLRLFRDGARVFVEAGARQALTGQVRACLPASALAAPLFPRRGPVGELTEELRRAGVPLPEQPAAPAAAEEQTQDAPVQAPMTPRQEPQASAPPPTSAPVPAPAPAPAEGAEAASPDGLPPRPQLLLALRSLYAEELGYPEEMLTEDIDLEADLGIDSIKQVEVFGDARKHFGLPQPPADVRLATAGTLAGIADVLQHIAESVGKE